jgi:acyl-CoA synthetase (AMP-forming)/AMP-acid ligase II/acetyltransferase-like isoleucine patch superfamily enzyme/acyl carrier protein
MTLPVHGIRKMTFHSCQKYPQRTEKSSIYQVLEYWAEQVPESIAIIAPESPPLPYGRLFRQVRNIVESLRAFGLNRNDRVATVLPNGPEMAVSFIGIACGATCAPLNPSYRANEFEFYLSDVNAKALILRAEMDSPARDVAKKLAIPVIELTPTPEAEAGVFELSMTKDDVPLHVDFMQPEDIALVLHTSGTTSRPKIVPLTHANICKSGHNISRTLELEINDRCLNVMPLFHIHGLIGAVLSTLNAGASIVCTTGFDAAKFFAWVDIFQPTWYTAVPTMHQAVLKQAPAYRQVIERRPMRFIRSCSAALPQWVMAELEDTFRVPVIESYGMTEASHQITSNLLPPSARKAGSVGIPAGSEVAIMNEKGSLLPVGEIGEVVIRGQNVTDGYENDPAANQATITNGWFRTGDQGQFDSAGYLFLTGRNKEIINRGGQKIAPKEVDDILMQHPAVAQAVAFAVPHPTLGEDIAAAVVLQENAMATKRDIRNFASERLSDYKVPNQLLIVEEIPKGPTGKLQRIGLADMFALKLKSKFVAAKNPVESELVELWKTLLDLEQVGIRDNYYALGGDSLALASMMIELESRFGKTIRLDDFLRSPTIENIAELLQEDETFGIRDLAGVEHAVNQRPIRDSLLGGLKNRLLQLFALYAPGSTTTRVWLHRMRGVSIGKNVRIGSFALIEDAYPRLVSIGDNVTIGIRVIIIGHIRDLMVQARAGSRPTVRIEENAYIGPGVIILPNVTIGHGAVVSAGSVVYRSVPPKTLVRGNPAEPIAHCGVSLGRGVPYDQFLRNLLPIKGRQ